MVNDGHVGSPVWLSHSELAWVPAYIQSMDGDTIMVKEERTRDIVKVPRSTASQIVAAEYETTMENGRVTRPKQNQNVRHILPRAKTEEKHFENMDSLIHLHEASILNNVRNRYTEDLIYTECGVILIALNLSDG